jgi:hypothetical protein
MGKLRGHFGAVLLLTNVIFPQPSSSYDSILSVEQPSGKVEIVIRNSRYEFQGGILRPNEAATIIVRNADKIQHGFTSTMLEDLDLRVETESTTTFGKGIKGTHINPGAIVRFHFIPLQAGKFSFQCDLHSSMKGELLLLSIGAI